MWGYSVPLELKTQACIKTFYPKMDWKQWNPMMRSKKKIHASIYDKTYGIKAISSPVSNRARQEIIASIMELKKLGAKAIVLGCTELPLAIPEKENSGLPVIDPNRILARALIREIDPSKLHD